jgi:signal transduction histidine kinase
MSKKFFFTIVLLICINNLFGQTRLQTDSTYHSIQALKNESVRTERFIGYLSKLTVKKSPYAGDLKQELLARARYQHDSLTIARILTATGFAYLSLGEFQQAGEEYISALPLMKKYGSPKQIIGIYQDLTWTQIQFRDNKKTGEYLSTALDLAVKYDLRDKEEDIYNMFGDFYSDQSKFDKAITYYNKALVINKKYGTLFGQINILTKTAESQRHLKQYGEALKILFRAKKMSDSAGNNYYKQAILQHIGETAFDNNDYKTSETYTLQAYQNAKNNREPALRLKLLSTLKNIYVKKGDYKNAFLYADTLEKLNGTVFAKENTKLTGEIETKYRDVLKDDNLLNQALLVLRQEQEIQSKKYQLELFRKKNEIAQLAFSQQQYQLANEKLRLNAQREKEALLYNVSSQKKDKRIASQQAVISSSQTLGLSLIIILGLVGLAASLLYYYYYKNRKLNNIISAQKHDLEITGQVKDRLFSVISHDMRAPINTLIALTQLLEDENISADNRTKYFIEIKKSLDHTYTLIENLLNWAAGQMQAFKPERQAVDVSVITRDVIMSITDFASIKNITIQNNISSQTTIVADVVMLQVVLRNLLTNAIKFTHDSGLVTINAEAGDLHVKLIVRDNGTGMSDSQVRNFNTISYSQFLESTPGTNKEKGTGLGLMLSKNFATLMDGTIHVESAKNEGTTFSLSLPKRINLN